MWELTERSDQKDSDPPLNSSMGSLEGGDMYPAFLPPPHVVAAPQPW